VLAGWDGLALGLLLTAALTDALDGWLARRLQLETPLGALLDPIADKALMSGSFLALGWVGALPVWLVGVVVARDLAILAGALVFRCSGRPLAPSPSRLSRWNTLMQVALAAVVLFGRALGAETPGGLAAVALALMGAVTLTTIGSGLTYAERGLRRWRTRMPPSENVR